MTKEEAKELWEKVKANCRALEACDRHEFKLIGNIDQSLRRRYRCSRCGGEIDSHAYHWYELGVRHGWKDAADG